MAKKELSGLQAAVMRVLWGRASATVADVHNALQAERPLAPTTVATILTRLAKQGFVTYDRVGRQYLYRAAVQEGEVQRLMARSLVQRLFQGDPAALVNHLVHENDWAEEDLAHLKALIEAKQRETR